MTTRQPKPGSYLLLTIATLMLVGFFPTSAESQSANPDLPKAKQTNPGLYVTAEEAYQNGCPTRIQ